jgi:broad specificity phosphatase PhoE
LRILIALSLFSGCAAPAPEIIMLRAPFTVCPAPGRPALRPLDPAGHLGARENAEALMENVDNLAIYARDLESALECYAGQTQ